MIADTDWVFTGEGSVDAQTMLGKTPSASRNPILK
jgi:glycerate kinase